MTNVTAMWFYLNKKQEFRGCVKQVEIKFVDVNRQAIKSSSLEALVQISLDVPNITAQTEVHFSWI